MKRVIAVVGVVVGLGAIGLTAAHAANSGPSTACTDGQGGEHPVPNPVVGLAVEEYPGYGGGNMAMLCWSTTPQGSGSPEAAGGQFRVEQNSSRLAVTCAGDRTAATMATIDCGNFVYFTDNPASPGNSVSLFSQLGPTSPVELYRTGAEVGVPSTALNQPNGGAAGSGVDVGSGSGTCGYADGTAVCVPGGRTIGVITVAEGDLPTATPTTTSPPPACTGVNNSCPGVTVRMFQDTSNPTLDVNLGITGVTFDPITTPQCVQVNSIC